MKTLSDYFRQYQGEPTQSTLLTILQEAKANGANDDNLILLADTISYKAAEAGLPKPFADQIENDVILSRLSENCAAIIDRQAEIAEAWRLDLEEEGLSPEEAIKGALDKVKAETEGPIN
ncbi:MAG TPA: hypothetical protein VEF04_13030 [Blastocatellia bacterium]|nr:hypothetical protein [Blastocatellia bacterium]